MHITDWFSTTWNSVLGHTSKAPAIRIDVTGEYLSGPLGGGIVDDFYWQMGDYGYVSPSDQFISGYLSGNFDPNDTGSVEDGNEDYFLNLKGGNGLCVFNGMAFNSGCDGNYDCLSGDGDGGFFESDGSDDFIGSCSLGGGGYSDPDFTVNLDSGFTVSIWTAMADINGAKIWSLGAPTAGGKGEDAGVTLIGVYEGLQLKIGNNGGGYAYFDIGGGRTDHKFGKGKIEADFWYHLTFVHDPPNTNGDVYQFYINGTRVRVESPEPWDGNSFNGTQKIAIGAEITVASPHITNYGHKFGHFHYYNRALEHSKIRQNYLATNQYYYKPGSGYQMYEDH